MFGFLPQSTKALLVSPTGCYLTLHPRCHRWIALRDAFLISPPLSLFFLFLPIITAGVRQSLHCTRPQRTAGRKCCKNSPKLTRQKRLDFLQFISNSRSFCPFYAELKKMVSDILRKTGSHFKTCEGKKILL